MPVGVGLHGGELKRAGGGSHDVILRNNNQTN